MECFRQIARCVKAPFERKKTSPKGLEIGPPMDFRKEEPPAFFSDDDTLTSLSLAASNMDKDNAVLTTVERQPTRDKIKHHVRRLSGKGPALSGDDA